MSRICSASPLPAGKSSSGLAGVQHRRLHPVHRRPRIHTASIRPSRSSSTCAAVVGLVCPKRFALGAATGTPALRINSSATGCAGIRTPTSGRPAVTTSGHRSRPRQQQRQRSRPKASISRRAAAGTSRLPARPASPGLATCTITGSHAGLCLAAKIRPTAAASSAFAPNP
jgi:hypothetical protein